jgi:hypothetical protein
MTSYAAWAFLAAFAVEVTTMVVSGANLASEGAP